MKLNKTAALLTIIIVLSFTTIIQQIQIFSLQSRFDVVESESGMRYSGNPFTTALYQGQLQAENITGMHYYTYISGTLYNRTDVIANPEQVASYIVWTDGTNVYAKNGTAGQIEFSGTDASVINSAINALPSDGGVIFIKQGVITGDITISRPRVIIKGEQTRLDGWLYIYDSYVTLIDVNVRKGIVIGKTTQTSPLYEVILERVQTPFYASGDVASRNYGIQINGATGSNTFVYTYLCKIYGAINAIKMVYGRLTDFGSDIGLSGSSADTSRVMFLNQSKFIGYGSDIFTQTADQKVFNVTGNNDIQFFGRVDGPLLHNLNWTMLIDGSLGSTSRVYFRELTSGKILSNYQESGSTTFSGTSVTFTHHLVLAPTHVYASFNSTSYGGWTWTANSTHITITVATSGNYTVYWKAEYKP